MSLFRRSKSTPTTAAEHLRRQLANAADWSITIARRRTTPGQPTRVTVDDVLARAAHDFNLLTVPPQAAAALRDRLHVRGTDNITTDAYHYDPTP
ncbi:hypothetical protein C8250_000405 [Streptomyces sp. So13.3]|uniref:hypothetical protein n=1 Tax=Streptomyces sp. So13.3 TaxID=2136173 RepID=UPI001106DE14|nr:hypothetical protein [Streptomyces sp. So13.3]QNA70626.1 hypothetical protein C8250_000405 [Streptomyces sp. So13.3]